MPALFRKGKRGSFPTHFVHPTFALAHGATDFFDGWMKDSRSALISCNDGFRPVSFLLEVMEEKS